MIEIRHNDRHGVPWVFHLNVNTVQEVIFKNLLASVRNAGSRAELSLHYYNETELNRAFFDDMERVILCALSKWASEREKPREPDSPADEGHTPYYWENF